MAYLFSDIKTKRSLQSALQVQKISQSVSLNGYYNQGFDIDLQNEALYQTGYKPKAIAGIDLNNTSLCLIRSYIFLEKRLIFEVVNRNVNATSGNVYIYVLWVEE